jgi:predicted dehydrogenase
MFNGCHWIDHFLYLNGYPRLTDVSVWEGNERLVNVSATAENGSIFTMVLTDVGSSRKGKREHVELRRGDTTVTITDGTCYAAETTRKRIRKRRIKRLLPYKIMYRHISNAIANGEPGDDLHSILVSTQSVLTIEQQYQAIHAGETV